MKKNDNKNDRQNLLELIKEQSDRINELRKENAELTLLAETYRKKEKEISDTLSFAKNRSEEIIAEAKVKFALECERIKIYRTKWTTLVNLKNNSTLAENCDKTITALRICQAEMENMLAEDLGEDMRAYVAERNRLEDEPQLDYQAIIKQKNNRPPLENNLSEADIKDLLSQL